MKLIFFTLLLLIAGCAGSKVQYNDPVPEHQSFTIQSKHLGELRTINVWTPPEYHTDSASLPVLYMPDGGIKEDFPHIANTLSALIEAKKIKPFILVGIENTQRRRDLTGPTLVESDKKIAPVVGGSAQFRNFIKDELFPEINKQYRTTNVKGIIGESLAGLFVTETFFQYPDMFNFYIAFDPSLWWNNHQMLDKANVYIDNFPGSDVVFWFAGSGTEDISSNCRKLAAVMKETASSHIKWKYSDEPNEKHSTIFRATKEKAIIWTLNNLPE